MPPFFRNVIWGKFFFFTFCENNFIRLWIISQAFNYGRALHNFAKILTFTNERLLLCLPLDTLIYEEPRSRFECTYFENRENPNRLHNEALNPQPKLCSLL